MAPTTEAPAPKSVSDKKESQTLMIDDVIRFPSKAKIIYTSDKKISRLSPKKND